MKILILLSMLFSGLVHGMDIDTVEDRKSDMTLVNTAHKKDGPALNELSLDAVMGKSYFLFEDGYECEPPTFNAQPKRMKTYKDRIDFGKFGVIFFGDGCNDAIRTEEYKRNLRNLFLFSSDLKAMTYKGKTYQVKQ